MNNGDNLKGVGNYMSGEKKEEKAISRRKYLSAIGGLGAAAAVGWGVAGYLASKPPAPAVVKTVTETKTIGEATVTKTVTGKPVEVPDITDWLRKVSGPYAGQTVNIIAESTATSQWLNEKKRSEFEEITGIKIHYELLGWDDVFAKARLDAAQKTGTYDLYYIDEREIMAEFFELGYIVDLYKVMRDYKHLLWEGWNLADILPLKYWIYKGMLAGAPFEHFLRLYVYRSDLFNDPKEKEAFKKKYGWDLRPGETYDEVKQIAEFFTRPDEDLYGWNQQPHTMSLPCDQYIGMMTYGVTGCGYTWGRRASWENGGMVDSPHGIAWLKRYIDLLKYCAPGIER
jgi:multiple sugar transport system substrate-binding protein